MHEASSPENWRSIVVEEEYTQEECASKRDRHNFSGFSWRHSAFLFTAWRCCKAQHDLTVTIVDFIKAQCRTLFSRIVPHYSRYFASDFLANLRRSTLIRGQMHICSRSYIPQTSFENTLCYSEGFRQLVQNIFNQKVTQLSPNCFRNCSCRRVFASGQRNLKGYGFLTNR